MSYQRVSPHDMTGPVGESCAIVRVEPARGAWFPSITLVRYWHAALRTARVLHAVPGPAEPEPADVPGTQQGMGVRDGLHRRAAAWLGHLGRTRLRLARLSAAVCLHPSGRGRAGTGPGDRLVCVGVLLRRP